MVKERTKILSVKCNISAVCTGANHDTVSDLQCQCSVVQEQTKILSVKYNISAVW